ncbi:conserved hypothetical protein [Cenarchaeum symbiosum A]|uniref:Blue (type 1) copper domain-containing protein n=1 Tax=Cenarchaeum symbiosum (strain A) TaxID=414004 RepID=A0RVA3_CENSY|nr:conserved hypothetical protein [Cenarchaeum symbiosum A]
MKVLNIGWFFTFFIIAAVAITTTSYADRSGATIIISENSYMQGCEETNECDIPSDVIIEQGDEITWINEDMFFHTVTSGVGIGEEDNLFDSGSVERGESYSRIFHEEPGDYPYFCSVHPWHTGTITVVENRDNGYDRGDERGYDRGDERGYDRGDERGYDRGDERGYDRGDERGYDRGDERDVNYTTSVLFAYMDRQTGVLEIVFDDTVDTVAIQPERIQVRNDTMSSLGITLSEMELVDVKNPGAIKFRLTEENRQEVVRYAQPLLYFEPTVLSDYGEEIFGISPRLTGFEHASVLHTGGQNDYFEGLVFSDDGAQMFMLGRYDHHMYRYDLSQPYNTTDSSFVDSVYVGPEDGNTIDFSFSANGTLLFVLSYIDSSRLSVHTYSLSEPYEIIAPRQVGSYDLYGGRYYGTGLYFSTTGDMMFVSNYRQIMTYKLPVPYDVSTAEYNSTQDIQTSILDMAFSPEGTRLFLMEYSMLDQYDLAEPYNLSSLNRSGSIDLQDNDATGLAFSGNGTKMFILQEDYVQEYHLPHTYDIAAPERDLIFHTGGQNDYFEGLVFSDDGAQMFMLGRYDHHMYRYDLSQPYNTTDSSFVDSVYVGPEDGNTIDFSFSANGTLLFVLSYIDSSRLSVHTYSLSEPYEIIAPRQVGSYDLYGGRYYGTGLYFSTTGDMMFVSNYRQIMTYKLPVPYDVSTAEYNSTQDIQTSILDMAFSPEGTRLFLMEYSMLDQYDLAEPYNLSSLNRSGSIDLQDNDATGLAFSGNGTKMFILQEDYVQEYELPIPFTIDLSRLVTSRNGLDSSGSVYDVAFSADGMAMFTGIAGHDAIYRYNLTSPYNTTSPLYVGMGRLGGDDDAAGIAFSADGSTIFVTRYGGYKYSYGYNSNQYVQEAKNASVHSYNLSSPYDISEPAASGSFELDGVHGTGDIVFSEEGMHVFVVAGESIRRYSLSSPYNITSPVPSGSYDLEEYVGQLSGLEFSADGMRMFVSEGRHVYGHDLGRAYDLDQVEYLGSFYTGGQRSDGLAFSADGTGLFVAGGDSISRYILTQYDITSPRLVTSRNGLDSSGSVYDVAFSADGMAMFTGIAGHDAIYRYNLTSPYNTTSPLYVGMGRLGGDDDAAGIAFSADGSTIFVTRYGGYKYSYGYNSNQYVQEAKNASVHSYNLSSPYDISEPAASGSFELDGVHGTGDIVFSEEGMHVFVVAGESIRRYSLSSPYNITSPVPSGSYDLEEYVGQLSGLEFSADGMRMFVSEGRHVYGHDLGRAYDLDQVEYLGSFYTGGQRADGLAFSADGTGLFVAGGDSISRYEPKEQIPQPTVNQDGSGMMGPDTPAMVETVSMDHQIAFASNTLQPDPQPVSQPNPQPDPRPRGGGGGGGGGTSTSITSIGRDVSLEFTADGQDASRGSSEIIIGTNMPLVISPLSADDLDVYDMEVIISSEDGQAKIYYNRIGAFFDRECEGDAAASGSLYTCDVQSLISPSGASYRDDNDGSFESLAVPLEGEFSGTMSMQLRDNSGIILVSHDKVYRINPSSVPVNALDTGPAPEVIIPVQAVEPEMDPEPVIVPEMDPEPVPAEPEPEAEPIIPVEAVKSDTVPGAEDSAKITPAVARVETGQEPGIIDAITEFFRSLLGL